MRLLFYICVFILCSTLTLNGSGGQISIYEEIYECLQNCAFNKNGHFEKNNYGDGFSYFDINMSDPDPKSDGCSLLHVAIGLGCCLVCLTELLQLGSAPYQLSKGSDFDVARTPIELAYHLGYDSIARFMERFFFKRICICIRENNGETLNFLLNQNSEFDINQGLSVNNVNMTFLHYDILCNGTNKNTSCTNVLLQKGLSPQATDSNGLTCIRYAKDKKDFTRLRLLKPYTLR